MALRAYAVNLRIRLLSLTGLLLVALAVVGCQVSEPSWVTCGQSMASDQVADRDYIYLANWLRANARPADEYFLSLFSRHDVVIFGEAHDTREHKEFIRDLVPRLYHEAGVRCIGWELSTPTGDAELERLTTAAEYDEEAHLQFARAQGAHAWNSKEHWEIVEAVRQLNASLSPGSPRLRLVGIDMEFDLMGAYMTLKTKAKDSPEYREVVETIGMRRDVVMAENAERETLSEGLKALLLVGHGHDGTHYGMREAPGRRPVMGEVLYDVYGDRVFQVLADWGDFSVMNRVMQKMDGRPTGFDMYSSPFRTILVEDGGGAGPVALERIARGYLYFGSRNELHRNTAAPGFVTTEMFEAYKECYRIDFARLFQSAKEVDDYFVANLWSRLQK